ncbi:hypothetical protein NW762_008153 [Fusarium torreyae]|uniref:Uncharacterized protein n=1 Tax=Fusarium torreyae TaxID=1237075 RepID=A0A9W8RYE7_9HYPO|nr:hypothetical protein NW762_008153 [Fusarium torreyae]
MHFSSLLPTLGGLVAIAQASPHFLPGIGGLGGDLSTGKVDKTVGDLGDKTVGGLVNKHSTVSPSVCALDNSWEDHTLFKGIAAPASGSSPAIHLGLNLPKAQISGDAKLELVKDFLKEPRVRVGLGGIKAYVEVDISASAAVHESIELFASPALDLEIPGLLEAEAGAAIALDLVIGVDAAIDLSAGVYLAFGEEAFVEISLLTKEIVDVSLEGLVTKALPIGVAADVDLSAEVALQLGLRLRTEVDLSAELEIPALEIEAGAKIAVWVSLCEYTAVLIATDDCAISVSEVIALTLGLAVDLNVEIGDILDISLAPTLTVTLATAAKAKVCQSDRGTIGGFLEGNHNTGSSTQTHVISLSTLPASGSDATSQAYPVGPDATNSDAYPAGPEATGSSDAYPAGPDATGSASYPVGGKPTGGYPVGQETPSYGSAAKPETTATPGSGNGTQTGDITSTLTSTHVYTVTSCAASVINCPARYTQKIVTSTIISSTYVCPATESGAAPATTTAHSTKVPVPVTTITDTLTTIVPCKTRTTSTFQPPTNAPPAPTVTIVDTTTYCPESDKTAQSTTVPSEATGSQAVTTSAPSTEAHEVPSSVAPTTEVPEVPSSVPAVPEKPTGDKPVLPPVQSVPYPHGNGTISTPVPVVPVPTGSYVPPVISTPLVNPIRSTPMVYPVASTPVATPVGTPPASAVPVSGASVVRTGLMLAIPAIVAFFM